MTQFLTRKRDKQAFPINKKVPRDSGIPQYMYVDKSQIEKSSPEYDLVTEHDSRASFYGKAKVRIENGKTILKSYNTDVAEIKDGKVKVHGTYSPTTLRHIKEFLKQHGYKAENSKQIIKDYGTNKDSDKDGVPDSKDCEPFNPNKQGKLHDIAVNLLRKREQKLEEKRIQEMKKLEEQREILKEQSAVQSVKNAKLQHRQAVIDEINVEKKKIKDLEKANKDAKKKIFDASPTGKAVKLSSTAIKNTQAFLNKPKTKKAINKIFGG